jgi:hypothetical protein
MGDFLNEIAPFRVHSVLTNQLDTFPLFFCQFRITIDTNWDNGKRSQNLTFIRDRAMSIHRIGYIRVSSLDQNAERQLDGIHLDSKPKSRPCLGYPRNPFHGQVGM